MLSRLKTALKRPPQHDGCLSLEFDSTSVYSPGSTISGVVHLQLTEDEAADRRGKGKMRGGTGRKAIDEVVVRLRVLQVSPRLPATTLLERPPRLPVVARPQD